MLKQHAHQASFECELTEGKAKKTSMTEMLVTFKMTHQTPASHKDEDTNGGNQNVISVLKKSIASVVFRLFRFQHCAPHLNENSTNCGFCGDRKKELYEII